jgi:hypothetical protein
MHKALFSVSFVVAVAPALFAGEANLVGQDAPEIQTSDWLGSDGRTRIADYRGEVVLLEAFATW